jgi:hypothetical protein
MSIIFHGVTSRDGAELAVTIPSSSCRNLKVRNNYLQEVTLLSSLAPAKLQVRFWELMPLRARTIIESAVRL